MSDVRNVQQLNAEASRRALQKRDKLDMVDAQCVVACVFDILREMPTEQAVELVSKGLAASARRAKQSPKSKRAIEVARLYEKGRFTEQEARKRSRK